MSRTTRIKNNYRETVQDCWQPRSVKPIHDFGWKEFDDCILWCYYDIEDKREYWNDWRYYHGDGKAYATYGDCADWVYRYFNRKDRHLINTKLRLHINAANDEDIVLPGKKQVPLAYF